MKTVLISYTNVEFVWELRCLTRCLLKRHCLSISVCVCVNNMFLSFCCIFSFLSLKEKELSFWFCSKVLWSIEFVSHVAWWFMRFLCVGAIFPLFETFSAFKPELATLTAAEVFLLLTAWDINTSDTIRSNSAIQTQFGLTELKLHHTKFLFMFWVKFFYQPIDTRCNQERRLNPHFIPKDITVTHW